MAANLKSPPSLRRLTKRREFLRAARGSRASKPSISLQTILSNTTVDAEDSVPMAGIGFTVTRKVGNAPERNRVKRRLRAAVRACAERFQPQYDYVLVGRRAALNEPFPGLVSSLEALVERVHANRRPAKRM